MKKINAAKLFFGLAIFCCINLHAQNPVSPFLSSLLQNKIDSFITAHSIPGISVSVILPGNQEWNGASGLSDIYSLAPMDTAHLFHMASVNKMYTAAMTFQLREQGLLSFDDTVGMFLPPMNNVPGDITIGNLLQHKTGIFDIAENTGISNHWINHPDSVWPHLQTIQTFVNVAPIFTQGLFFDYSNTNYILLGMIMEQVTGNTFASELHNRFLIPLGLAQTFFEPEDSVAGPYTPGWTSFTTPGVYDTNADLILNDCSASMFFTAGSIVAKPADVARFTRELWSGNIISDSSLNLMKICTSVNMGAGCDGYGYGTMRYKFGGKTYYGHAGDVNGFTQLSIHQQEDSITLTISVNRNSAPRGPMAMDLLSLVQQVLISIEEAGSMKNYFTIFPNPASEKINMNCFLKEDAFVQLSIKDELGRTVSDRSIFLRSKDSYSIDISSMRRGIYFIQATSSDFNISRGFIKK